MTRIIAFTGRKRSGKDTAAKRFIDQGYQRLAFAGALKEMLRTLLRYQGVDEETIERMIEGDLKEVPTKYLGGRTPRHAMQTLGTEWGRDCISEDLWVGVLCNAAVNYDQVVVTDMRFPNEAEAMHSLGAKVVRVARPGVVSNDNHPSELLIDELPVHEEIVNDGSIDDLHQKLAKYST